jgi:hypothetical protein
MVRIGSFVVGREGTRIEEDALITIIVELGVTEDVITEWFLDAFIVDVEFNEGVIVNVNALVEVQLPAVVEFKNMLDRFPDVDVTWLEDPQKELGSTLVIIVENLLSTADVAEV